MKSLKHLVLPYGLVLLALPGAWAARKPLHSPELRKLEYRPTATRVRVDPKTGRQVEYKVDGVISYDPKNGSFVLSWTGADERRQTIVYQPPNLVEGTIAAAVSYDHQKGVYLYSYSVSNSKRARQRLQSLYIENRAPVENASSPDASWYSSPFTNYLRKQLRVALGWTWSQTKEGRLGIEPGEASSGFSYESADPPAPVVCYVRGYTEPLRANEDLPEELHAAIDGVAWRIPKGLTMGPRKVAQPLDVGRFIQEISEMIDISVRQGWMESPALAKRLKLSVLALGPAFRSSQRAKSLQMLEVLLKDIESEKGRALLSEAYGLLKYNLEFLRDSYLTYSWARD